jgi:hypothetical protein
LPFARTIRAFFLSFPPLFHPAIFAANRLNQIVPAAGYPAQSIVNQEV